MFTRSSDQPRVSNRAAPICTPRVSRIVASLAIAITTQLGVAGVPDLGAFDALQAIPADIDAAAVFENPADAILLSPVGRSMRSLLAMGGVFTQTERAWQALGDAFDAPVDDTIRALLSKRVVVVWDGFERGDPDMEGITESIDTRWALICQVEPQYLREITAAMRPVKRDIVHGRPVYAIEQGRYRVVMLDNPKPGTQAIVLLAPSSGTQLLHNVLAQIVNNDNPNADTEAITSGHHDMLAALNQQHANVEDGSWSFALLARTSVLYSALTPPSQTKREQGPGDTVIAAMVKLDPGQLRCTFSSDLAIRPDTPDAPVALLDAISSDAVFALASGRAPRLSIDAQSASIALTAEAQGTQAPDESDDDPFNAPALITISPIRSTSGTSPDTTPNEAHMGISITLCNPKRPQGESARLADDTVNAFVDAYDSTQAPSFNGRLPSVVRSITLQPTPQPTAQPEPADGSHSETAQTTAWPGETWPGETPSMSWLTATTLDNDLLIATMGPGASDPAQRVLDIKQAAITLDALGAKRTSGVLMRAHAQPARLLALFGEASLMDLALAKLVREMNIEIRRGIRDGVRGSLELRFANAPNQPGLGTR
jgi:hypothetical protein